MRSLTRSLRGKIFLAVLGLLLIVAGAVIPVTQRDVTRTVEAGERHAIDNVLSLVQRDTEARWGALLDDKIRSVRSGRAQLMELGTTIQSVLGGYAAMAERGLVSTETAQRLASAWLNRLSLGKQRYAFIYNARHQVLASGMAEMIGADLSDVRDIKGRPLAQALYDESRYSGHGFALYRWATPAQGAGRSLETRYGYFGYFPAWDWVLAVSDSAQEILDQVQAQRAQMESALLSSLSSLTLAQSGFVFILADNGRFIVPPPEAQAPRLLDAIDLATNKPLRASLPTPQPHLFTVTLSDHETPWFIQTIHYKPLGWTLAAAVPQSDLQAPARSLIRRQALIFAGALLLALALAWLIATRITRPLDTLTQYARSLPDQDLTTLAEPPTSIAALPARHRDEVGRLASSFLFMQDKLGENVARLMQETSVRERFESELNIARDIQMGLLPLPLPPEIVRQADLHAAIQPAKEVGGDLYDYFPLPDGRLCFAIGDVSDKGVPAALFMAVTRTLIRATTEDETDPARIMHRINNRLAENNPNMMFVTLLLGVLDLQTGHLIWANAGHPPPAIIAPDGQVRLLTGRSGPACGVQEDLSYQPLESTLLPGETLLGYTDGVTDATNLAGEQYGEAQLLAQLATPADNTGKQIDQLLADLRRFTDGADPFDDITLIAIRRT